MNPLTIGTGARSLPVDPPLVLAPLAGYTDRAFRALVKRIGGCGLVVTEMVSSEGLTRGGVVSRELATVSREEGPVAIQIFGSDPARMADAAARAEEMGASAVDVNMGCPMPKVTRTGAGAALLRDPDRDAFLSSRSQYNAMALIKYLNGNHSDNCLKVIGITSKDITNPILTYVFGEAYMDGTAAVMSSFRLRMDPGGKPVSREKFLERVVKVAIHEIGHTFNIPHCHTGRCVMRASNGLAELDEKLNYLCRYCEFYLAESLTKALSQAGRDQKIQESV